MVSQIHLNTLQNVKQFIKQSHFEEALALCVHIQNETNTLQEMLKVESIPSKIIPLEHYMSNQQYWELESLRAYCLANIDRVSQAIERSQKCMKQMPRHSPTIRRLASYYEKQGSLEEALKLYKLAEIYQPDSHHISQKIIKLQSKLNKNQSILMNAKNTTSHSLQASTQENSKLHVTFGNSQVFQMASEDSDEYFAHIKSQLNKLSETKPKKSILKCSKSLNKISDQKVQISHHSEEEKYEYQQMSNKKALSIKSQQVLSPKKWDDEQQIQKQKSNVKVKVGQKKEKPKKKSVCFSFEGEDQKKEQQ